MTIDPTITIGTLVNAPLTILLFTILFALLSRYWKRVNRNHAMQQIKLDSIIHAVFIHLNGQGEEVRKEYERKKKELMAEQNFKDSEG